MLYQRLKDSSFDSVADRIRLDALHATLQEFGIKRGQEWEVFAEMILNLEINPVSPADGKMRKLMEMCFVFKDKQ